LTSCAAIRKNVPSFFCFPDARDRKKKGIQRKEKNCMGKKYRKIDRYVELVRNYYKNNLKS